MLWIFVLSIIHHHPISALTTTTTTPISSWGGWRLVLDIGREPYTTMPRSWASSGARFPLVMKCNFTEDGTVASISGDVRYTTAEGGMIKPVHSGSWSLSPNNRDLSFTLTFPEEMIRNDVEFGPCEVVCEGLLFTKADLDILDQDFYRARTITDDINAKVKESKRRREAPKKWNFDTNRWEKRYKDESFTSMAMKKIQQLTAIVIEEVQNKKRPKFIDMSLERGNFPGIDGYVYMGKGGKVKIKGGAIIGKWAAEPIIDTPPSYYRNR